MTKKCCNCFQDKLLKDFAKKINGLQSCCKQCSRQKNKDWYAKNKKDKIKKAKIYKNRKKEEYWLRIKPIMDEGCKLCGEMDECVLDFHHVGNKSFDISTAITNNFSWKKITRELKECVCLCANCHRKVHAHKIDISNIQRCMVNVV